MKEALQFSILYEDEYLVAINKPNGIMVHPTKITEDKQFILPLLEVQIEQKLNPIHRLDRGTSGVLLFGKGKEATKLLNGQFREQRVGKTYIAIVRGFTLENGVVDYPIAREPNLPKRTAITHYTTLQKVELPFAISRYATARYSLVEAIPKTGRRHQIRRHFSHLRHPVIGDKRHGDIKHNKYWKETLGIGRMLLHARLLQFQHPFTEELIVIEAPLDVGFLNAMELLGMGNL